MTNHQPPPPPSHDGHPQPPMARQRRSPFILSQVAKEKFGSSVNIHTAPKDDVEAITGAARIREIASSIGINTTKGANFAGPAVDNTEPEEIPADTEALNVNGYREETLHTDYYCFQGDFAQYKTTSTNGVPDLHLKGKICTLVSGLAYYIKAAGGCFSLLPYDENSTAKAITRATDLPDYGSGLEDYITEPTYNSVRNQITFHIRILTSIRLTKLKARQSPVNSLVKKSFFNFLVTNGFYFNPQQVSSTQMQKQGWLFGSHAADGIDHIREQLTAFFNAHGIAFNHNKWQVSSRQLRVKKPNTRGEFVKTEALWIECTEDIVSAVRAAFRLITPSSADGEYPLLWNLLFVQSSRFMEFGNKEMYQLALKQKRFVDGRYTLTVRGWNPEVNLFVDAPWISGGGEGDAEILSANRCLASLLLTNAKGKAANGSTIQLFSKIQPSERNPDEWHFQCARVNLGLARLWLDKHLVAFLKKKFEHAKNGEDGTLSFADLGAIARKTDTHGGYAAPGDDPRGEGTASERYLDACRVTAGGSGAQNQASQKTQNRSQQKQQSQQKHQAKKQKGQQLWSSVVSQDIPEAASDVASFPTLPSIPGSPSRESKAASKAATTSFHAEAVSPLSAITQQPSVTSDHLSSLTDSIEALKQENLKQKEETLKQREEFEILLDDHKTIVHNAMVEGQEKLALYVREVVAVSMERSYTASAYDLSRTANILNSNINLLGEMLAEMTSKQYRPLQLPPPGSGPSQEGAQILANAAQTIGLIPLPLFELETASQSSFDPDAQVLDLASSASMPDLEDGEEQVVFGPAERETTGLQAMEVEKKEREKRKSSEFEKRETTSEDDESSQNKRRSGDGSEKSVPIEPGETPNLQ
jgi:hypothetical protein